MAGLEVLLADGDVVRTGQFGITNSASAHLSKFSFGPSIEGLFLQSNLGIVTKLGLWLTPQPDAYLSCFFEMPELDDIETMTNAFGSLRQSGVIPNTVFVSNIVEVMALIKKRVDIWDGEGPIPQSVLRQVQKEYHLGYWNAKFGLFGPRRILQAQLEEIQHVLSLKAPTGTLRSEMFSGKDGSLLDASNIPEPHGGPFVGVPTLWSLPMIKFKLPKDETKGVAGHGGFSSIIPSTGRDVLRWVRESRRICEKHGLDLFCDFFMHEKHVIFVNFQPFDKSRVDQQNAVQGTFADMYKVAKVNGYSNYRSHVNHMGTFFPTARARSLTQRTDAVAELYDFNEHAYRRFVEKLKVSIVDLTRESC